MKLHANAALSLNKRRRLCRRVSSGSWTLTKAAEAAEVSVRCARKWVGRYRGEGELGLLDRSSAPHRSPTAPTSSAIEAIAALRRLRFTGPEIAEVLGMALSTVSGILTRIGMGKLGRLGLEPAVRYERARPGELIHIDVKKLGRIERGAGQRVTGERAHKRHRADAAGVRRGASAGSSCTSPSTTAPAWPTPRSSPTRRPPPRSGSCAAPSRSSAATASPSSELLTDNGSAYRSTVHAHRLPRPGHPPPAHPPLPPPDQRQGRALHPHHARRLGLRRDLPRQRRTHRRP